MRVLVIQKDSSAGQSLLRLLESRGIDVLACDSGIEAIRVAKRIRPDLLLTDIDPAMGDAVEVCAHIQQILPECAIFLMSERGETSRILDQAAQRGLNFPVIVRPEALEQLSELLGRAIRRREEPPEVA